MSPIRSSGKRSRSSRAAAFAASKRLGLRSVANMDRDTSRAIMMLRALIFSRASWYPALGEARDMIIKARAIIKEDRVAHPRFTPRAGKG